MKGPTLFQGEMIRNYRKYIDEKSFYPEALGQFLINFEQSIIGLRDFKVVQKKGPAIFQGEIQCNNEIVKKLKFKILLQNHWANINQT